jgi:hypothetical protein
MRGSFADLPSLAKDFRAKAQRPHSHAQNDSVALLNALGASAAFDFDDDSSARHQGALGTLV